MTVEEWEILASLFLLSAGVLILGAMWYQMRSK